MRAETIYQADWVLPVRGEPIARGAVAVNDGVIVAVGEASAVLADRGAAGSLPRRVDLGAMALLPGLVNPHAHLELTAFRGWLEDLDFFAWIRRLTRTKYEVFEPSDWSASARWGAWEAVRAGVTSVGEISDLGASREAMVSAGLRGVLYQEVFGPDPRQREESLRGLEERVAAHAGSELGHLRLGVSPHAPYTVSAELFRDIVEWAVPRGLPLSVHAAESRAEREFLRDGSGPFGDLLRARGIETRAPGVSPIAYLESLGVLAARPLLAHVVDASDGDLDLVARAGATIAHCPKSNAKLGHGIAPFRGMRERGIACGIGSDGVLANNAMDLLEEARFAGLAARAREPANPGSWPSARELLRALTLDGARALGLDAEIGSLEVGKRADLVAIDLSGAHLAPVHDVETALIYSASASDVRWVVVDGEELLRAGLPSRVDPEALRAELDRSVAAWTLRVRSLDG